MISDKTYTFIGKHLVDAAEMSEVLGVLESLCFPGSRWCPAVGAGPRCYLLTIYVAQRPYRSPAQPAAVPPPTSSKHSLPTSEPTIGSQEVLDKNKNKARTRLPSYLRTNQRIRTRQDEGKVNVRKTKN